MTADGVPPGAVGDLDMDAAATSQALDAIQRPVDGWAAAWPSKMTAIHTAEVTTQTGFDDVSVQFRTAYNQIAPELNVQAGAFAPRVLRALGTGRTIVARYAETFQQATDQLRPR
jgi:hypothetical protein